MKNILKRIILGYKATSESYIAHLRKIGMSIGEDVILFRPFNTTIDEQNPHMISIGSHVMITGPVTILSHDYSWSVLKRKYGDILGNQRRTIIGDNVFIGWGATILGGSVIEDNVVIGAGSVVSGILESDMVYAGNPARKVLTLEEFYKKRKKNQLKEAVDFVNRYNNVFGKMPEEKFLKEYFFLFSNSSKLCPEFEFQMRLMGNRDKSIVALEKSRQFEGYEEFIGYCNSHKE